MEAAKIQRATGDEMMAGPGNALAGRRMDLTPRQGPSPQNDSAESELISRLNELGYKGEHDDLPTAMKFLWDKSPTDMDAELIDMLSSKYGVPPPWKSDGDGKMMKLGGPEPHDGPDAWYDREKPMDGNVLDNSLTGRGFAKKADGRLPYEASQEWGNELLGTTAPEFNYQRTHPARDLPNGRNTIMMRRR
jgi:hypothetical protein